jgi:hypothetical protein
MEIAIAAVLLMGSLTLTQYFRKIVREPWGFSTERRVVFNAMLSERLFSSAESRTQTIEKTLSELRALPGVRSAAGTARHLPRLYARRRAGIFFHDRPTPFARS